MNCCIVHVLLHSLNTIDEKRLGQTKLSSKSKLPTYTIKPGHLYWLSYDTSYHPKTTVYTNKIRKKNELISVWLFFFSKYATERIKSTYCLNHIVETPGPWLDLSDFKEPSKANKWFLKWQNGRRRECVIFCLITQATP